MVSDGTTRIESLRRRIDGTTIDDRSLLSTDFFNHANEAIMLLGLLPDMPDMLDELKAWRPKSYAEHFRGSSLPFADLAIECYDAAEPQVRSDFDAVVSRIEGRIADAVARLDVCGTDPEFRHVCDTAMRDLTNLVGEGSGVVHGVATAGTTEGSSDQSAIDALFD
ncbi:MAG: hypothetical protein ACK5YI_22670 [Rhodospirillales bacterium]|jgi:hypothetical protein